MVEYYQKLRKKIKRHILNIYDGTNDGNKEELEKLLEFVISNYDLEDNLFNQIKDDLQMEEDDCQDIYSLENEEFQNNVLNRRNIW